MPAPVLEGEGDGSEVLGESAQQRGDRRHKQGQQAGKALALQEESAPAAEYLAQEIQSLLLQRRPCSAASASGAALDEELGRLPLVGHQCLRSGRGRGHPGKERDETNLGQQTQLAGQGGRCH